MRRLLAIAALAAATAALAAILRSDEQRPRTPPFARLELATPTPTRTARPSIRWRRSTALGSPTAGRLVRGVRLPAEGRHFATWDPVRKRTPNRWWRRYGTDELVRTVLRVTREFAAAHPRAPRVLIGDLSRPRGGDFGRRYGPLGHVSHQNGLDADVYFPRRDRRERAPRTVGQVDRRLAQDLVDRFVRAGARTIFVGARLRLHGRGVQPWPNHDNHLHVRF
jgi:murein endopeptidase